MVMAKVEQYFKVELVVGVGVGVEVAAADMREV
jgi:hypothetical protein